MTIEQYKAAEIICTKLENIKRELKENDGQLILCMIPKLGDNHSNVPILSFSHIDDGDYEFIATACKDYFESKIKQLETELENL